MVGTGGHGHAYPGATRAVRHGAAQPRHSTRTLGRLLGLPLLRQDDPAASATRTRAAPAAPIWATSASCRSAARFREAAKGTGITQASRTTTKRPQPGYYASPCSDPKIKVELTATAQAGFHRYTFPGRQAAHLALDLGRGIGERAGRRADRRGRKEHDNQRLPPQPRLGERPDVLLRRRVLAAVRVFGIDRATTRLGGRRQPRAKAQGLGAHSISTSRPSRCW